MAEEKIPHEHIIKDESINIYKIIFIFSFILMNLFTFFYIEADAGAEEAISVIKGVKVRQIGGTKIIIEIRGSNISKPVELKSPKAAALLGWDSAVFFAGKQHREAWEDESGWKRVAPKAPNKDRWISLYNYPLAQRVEIVSSKRHGLNLVIIGEEALKLEKITCFPGSEQIKIELVCHENIVNRSIPAVQEKMTGDPLGMSAPTTLELWNVPAKEVFRIIAETRGLNLILDSSVPETLMTFSFKATKFSEIFSYLLRMNNLNYAMAGKTLVIGTAESIGRTLGRNMTVGYRIAYGDIAKMPAIIMGLISLVSPPIADERTRTLYITCTAKQHTELAAIMRRLDSPGKQIMLEARLIEVNDSFKDEVDSLISSIYKGWLLSYGAGGGLSFGYKNNSDNEVSTYALTKPELTSPAVNMLDASLRLMENDNKGKVLANPSIVTLDGQKSTIKLTHNYLYQSGTDDKGNPHFSEEETGPTLEITPTLGRDGFITLKLKILTGEIIQFRKSGTSEAPETTKRELETQIRVRDGELFVIGGLYQENKSKYISKVPILGDIPLLGELFKSRSNSHTKSEMIFILVPYILDIPTGEQEEYPLPLKELAQ